MRCPELVLSLVSLGLIAGCPLDFTPAEPLPGADAVVIEAPTDASDGGSVDERRRRDALPLDDDVGVRDAGAPRPDAAPAGVDAAPRADAMPARDAAEQRDAVPAADAVPAVDAAPAADAAPPPDAMPFPDAAAAPDAAAPMCASDCSSCGAGGCCNETCAGRNCSDCTAFCACDYACTGNECRVECRPGSTCHAAGSGGRRLEVTCRDGASCTAACDGYDECTVRCEGMAQCAITSCTGMRCDLMCPMGQGQSCPNGGSACRRGCP